MTAKTPAAPVGTAGQNPACDANADPDSAYKRRKKSVFALFLPILGVARRNSDAAASFGAAACQNLTTTTGAHTLAKAMHADAAELLALIGSLGRHSRWADASKTVGIWQGNGRIHGLSLWFDKAFASWKYPK